MNDGISREPSSLSYISVDDVVDRVLQLGYGELLAKMDAAPLSVCTLSL